MTEHLDPLPAGPQRPRLDVGRLWAGDLATAVVAALIGRVPPTAPNPRSRD